MATAHVATICSIAHDSSGRGAGTSLRDLLKASDYARHRSNLTVATLAEHLVDRPEVVTQWAMYSEDKRTNGGWYFLERGQGWTVGRLGPNAVPTDERHYGSAVEACADFILLELDFWASRSHG
jgi:hypothetical protein